MSRSRPATVPADEPAADFVTIDGTAAIEAERYSRSLAGETGDWTESEIRGRVSGRTVAVGRSLYGTRDTPVTAAPCLEYDVELGATGTVAVEVQCIPTQAINEQRDLRYAVAVDDAEPTTVSIDPDGGEHDLEWQRNVLRGAAIGTSAHEVDDSRTHTLRLWGLDPGLVVDRIVVSANGERTTYLGPRETAIDGT